MIQRLLILVAMVLLLSAVAIAETRQDNKLIYYWDGSNWNVTGYIQQREKTPVFDKDTRYYYDSDKGWEAESVVRTPKTRVYNPGRR